MTTSVTRFHYRSMSLISSIATKKSLTHIQSLIYYWLSLEVYVGLVVKYGDISLPEAVFSLIVSIKSEGVT